jgi:hypothetical protein
MIFKKKKEFFSYEYIYGLIFHNLNYTNENKLQLFISSHNTKVVRLMKKIIVFAVNNIIRYCLCVSQLQCEYIVSSQITGC